MSRNKEKANSLLHRYYSQKQDTILPTASTPRPRKVQSVTSIPVAEKFRTFVIREISNKVTRINDPVISLSEIRDLNDQINKLINEKLAWEHHIRELGGPDYVIFSKKQLAKEIHIRNHRYFGRAKELPDVKEFLDLKKNQKDEKLKLVKNLSNPKALTKYVKDNIKNLDLVEYYDVSEDVVKGIKNKEQIMIKIQELLMEQDLKSESAPEQESNKRQKLDPKVFDEFNPPSMEDIEQVLVERRKEQLLKRLNS